MRKMNLSRRQSGQGMTEYIIIVALIAIAAIGVVTVFGDNLRQLFGGAATALAGDEMNMDLKDAANESRARDLKDFNEK